MKSLSMNIQMKATEQYFLVVLFIVLIVFSSLQSGSWAIPWVWILGGIGSEKEM